METVFKKGHVVRSRSYYMEGGLLSELRYKRGVLQRKRTFHEDGTLGSEWLAKTGIIQFYDLKGILTLEKKVQY